MTLCVLTDCLPNKSARLGSGVIPGVRLVELLALALALPLPPDFFPPVPLSVFVDFLSMMVGVRGESFLFHRLILGKMESFKSVVG